MCNDHIQRVNQLAKNVKESKFQITDVVLVGGSTRIPMVQRELEQIFKSASFNKKINADESVAKGAIIYASSITGFFEKML